MKTFKIIPPVTMPNNSTLLKSGEVFVAGGCILSMENEIFTTIPGYENYEITESGKVRRKDTGYIMKVGISNKGYCYVVLCDLFTTRKHKSGRQLLHRMLCITFKPNPENKRTVNHKDGNKLNNNLDNLEWATDQENIEHAFATNLNEHSDRHYRAKVTNEQVFEIRGLGENKNLTHKEIAKIYNISQTTATNIINKKVYKRI